MRTRIFTSLAFCVLTAGCTKTTTTPEAEKNPEPRTTVAASMARPCELVVEPCERDQKSCAGLHQCNVTLARINPEGIPLDLNLDKPFTWSWKFATDGRLQESPNYTYAITPDGTGVRTSREDGRSEKVKFDARANLVEIGESGKITYTADGLTSAVSHLDGDQTRTIHYRWGENGKYTVDHDYPDSEEVCEPAPDEVTLDAQGRVVQEKSSGCQINYSPFVLKYEYDAQNRPSAIAVTCYPAEPTAVTWHLKLKYDCK